MEVKALGAWGVSLEKGDNSKVWLGVVTSSFILSTNRQNVASMW